MLNRKYSLVMLTVAMVGAAVPANSQSAPPPVPIPEPAAPVTDKAPPAPSAETLKRAKAVGLRPETRKGGTVYCWEDATVGTRFTTKKCVNDNQLADLIAQREAQQDRMRKPAGT